MKANGTPGQFRYIASKNLGTGWASYALYTGGTGGLVFYVGNAATFTLSPAATHTTVWDGEWHHIVGTYDGTQVRLYFDGSLAGVTATSIGIGYNSEEFEIGDNRLGPVFEHHFVGEIDAVKVWNRALTPTEIAQFDPCTPDTPPNTPPSASAGGSA